MRLARLRRDDPVSTGTPAGWHLAQLAEVDVSVQRVRQRARDRRRGHGEVVGHRSRRLAQTLPLGHAETMLLVDDDEAEVDHRDVVLDERVGPDDERVVAAREAREDLAPRGRRGAADQQPRREAVRAEELVESRVVLPRQDLGGRHHRRLKAGVVGHERGERRDHRLAAADVTLEQPVHRARGGEVGEDLVRGDALTVGELERQRRDETPRKLDVVRDDHAGSAHAPPARALRGHLEQEQLLKGDALASPCRRSPRPVRHVHLVEGFGDRHQPFRIADRRRQPVGDLGREARAAARSACAGNAR